MVYEKIETKISEEVKECSGEYIYYSDTFGGIEVRPFYEDVEDCVLFQITNEQFAKQRLKRAQKHWRDYGQLPDKGQFPYISYKNGKLVFNGKILITDSFDSDRLEKASE